MAALSHKICKKTPCLALLLLSCPQKIVETFLRPLSSSLPTPVAHGNQYFFTNTNDIRKLSNDQSQVQILYTDSDHPQVMSSFKDLLYRNRTSSSSRFDLYTHVSRIKNHFCLFPCNLPLSSSFLFLSSLSLSPLPPSFPLPPSPPGSRFQFVQRESRDLLDQSPGRQNSPWQP